MSKLLIVFALTLITGLLSFSVGDEASAQDCERAIPGNTQSPCKQLDYLDGIQPPTIVAEQFTDDNGRYACQGFIEFKSATPLQDHSEVVVAGSNTYAAVVTYGPLYPFRGKDSRGFSSINYYASGKGSTAYSPGWPNSGPAYNLDGNRVVAPIGPPAYLNSSIYDKGLVYRYLVVAAWFGKEREAGRHVVISETFDRPREVADYQLVMNQCLAGITRQLEQDAAVEAARKQANEDKVKAETAAEEARSRACCD